MEEYKLNSTDRTIIRQLSLCHLFLQHPNGISFDDIDSIIYDDGKTSSIESHKRLFHRDRETLEDSLGFYTRYDETSKLYACDVSQSMVEDFENILSRQEKLMIRNVTIPHLMESYAEQSDLIIALNKLGTPLEHSKNLLPKDVDTIDYLRGSLGIKYVIWNCFTTRTACKVVYTTAEGNTHEYTAKIYGTFSVADNQYFVANISDNEEEDIRTLRYDRVDSIKPLKGYHHYEIPEDYQDSKYLKLPFQIGQLLYPAQVYIEKEKIAEFASKYREKGMVQTLPNGAIIWTIDVSDEDIMLYWLISHGFIPVAPASLKDKFISRLEKVIHNAEK